MPTLENAVHTIVRDCLGVREGEQVLIVSDPANESLGLSFRADAESVGADAVLALIAEREEHGTEPPPDRRGRARGRRRLHRAHEQVPLAHERAPGGE